MFQSHLKEGRVAVEEVLMDSKHGILDQDVEISSQEVVVVRVDDRFWGTEEGHVCVER